MNSPAPKAKAKEAAPKPKAPTAKGAKAIVLPSHSHYLQSKVVRALERIEAELKVAKEDGVEEPKAEPTPETESATETGTGKSP